MADKKQCRLSFPIMNTISAPIRGSIFGNYEDTDEKTGADMIKQAVKAANDKNKMKKQDKLNLQKALKEDPTIFQYDEVYGEIERTKKDKESSKTVEKRSKYYKNMLKNSELRKEEHELRKDVALQKKTEAQKNKFSDKEKFVTSSYKAKLEETKKFEKEQANQDRLESIGDVTKQKDMTGFYRHIFRQTVERNEANLGIASQSKKSETVCDKPKPVVNTNLHAVDPIASSSDFIIELESPAKKQKLNDASVNENADKENKIESNVNAIEGNDNESKGDKGSAKVDVETKVEEVKLPKVEKAKINISEKRTVGVKFEEVVQRYMLRKQERYGS